MTRKFKYDGVLGARRAPAREGGNSSLQRLWAKRSAATVRRGASLARDLDVSGEGGRAAREGDQLRVIGIELSLENRATRPDVSHANSRSALRKCPSRGNVSLRQRYLRFLINEVPLLPGARVVRCAQRLSPNSFDSHGGAKRPGLATKGPIRQSQLVNRCDETSSHWRKLLFSVQNSSFGKPNGHVPDLNSRRVARELWPSRRKGHPNAHYLCAGAANCSIAPRNPRTGDAFQEAALPNTVESLGNAPSKPLIHREAHTNFGRTHPNWRATPGFGRAGRPNTVFRHSTVG